MSPRTPEQFEEMREERKTLIMDVALEHFAREGYHKTTINHIARHARISKGLMYNYFTSKESLLFEIIMRSVNEMYADFDRDKDGYLSRDEFEFFIRRLFNLLKEKKTFWRLLFQLIMQNEVREKILNSFPSFGIAVEENKISNDITFLNSIVNILTDYFVRKKERERADYNPLSELNLFILTLKGFALSFVYMEDKDDGYYEKTINDIIEKYK
ncbi:MAG: TetR/AcrR family transcriptional regulator [Bacteroidales bacterium]|nr:TetR/AcrR family transcriptional regulator [Bacteroidales bacterium]